MNITSYRNALIATSLAAGLGLGATACSEAPDYSASDTRSTSDSSGGIASTAASDTAITSQVQAKLATDSTINASEINVATDNDVVTLEGSVSDDSSRSAAERVTKTVTGVTRVNNRLSTSSSGMSSAAAAGDTAKTAVSDTWITTKVKSMLLADSDASGFDVSVETQDGVVMLEGNLQDRAAIAHAERIAAGVDGVKRVDTSALTVASRR